MKKWNALPDFLKVKEVEAYYVKIKRKGFSRFIKRAFDLFVAFVFFLILCVPMLIIGFLVKVTSRGPVFYRQKRIGIYGKTFGIFKFRTMIKDADKVGNLITSKNDSRITGFGKFLRKTKLDEIPQILNILAGDMSFVGTRPEVSKYVDMYTPEMRATLLMRPGVTSTASIKYRDENDMIPSDNALSEDETYMSLIVPKKMKYNLEYLTKFNLFLDMGIMFKTFFSMFKRNKK